MDAEKIFQCSVTSRLQLSSSIIVIFFCMDSQTKCNWILLSWVLGIKRYKQTLLPFMMCCFLSPLGGLQTLNPVPLICARASRIWLHTFLGLNFFVKKLKVNVVIKGVSLNVPQQIPMEQWLLQVSDNKLENLVHNGEHPDFPSIIDLIVLTKR